MTSSVYTYTYTYTHIHTHIHTHTHTHAYIQKIFPAARSVKKCNSLTSGTFFKRLQLKDGLVGYKILFAYFVVEAKFWFILVINLCRHFFAIFLKKVLDQNGPYIKMFQTNLRNLCLSVILEFYLSSSSSSVVAVCVLAPPYLSLCRSLEYLLTKS